MTDGRQARTDEEFKAFVQARWPELVRYAYLLLGDVQHAKDVVQIALERTWRRWRRVGVDRPESYVRTAIARQTVSRHRWLGRRVPERPFGERPPEPAAAADDSDADEYAADILGCSVGAVKSQLSRGLARLRARSVLRNVAGLPFSDPSVRSSWRSADDPAH